MKHSIDKTHQEFYLRQCKKLYIECK